MNRKLRANVHAERLLGRPPTARTPAQAWQRRRVASRHRALDAGFIEARAGSGHSPHRASAAAAPSRDPSEWLGALGERHANKHTRYRARLVARCLLGLTPDPMRHARRRISARRGARPTMPATASGMPASATNSGPRSTCTRQPTSGLSQRMAFRATRWPPASPTRSIPTFART